MKTQAQINALKAKQLCYRCVGEAYLKGEMLVEGVRRKCSYCGRTAKGYRIEAMADRIESVFEEHFYRTSDNPDPMQSMMLADRESNYEWDRDGCPVVDAIANSADMPEEAASDIQIVLEDKYQDFEAQKMGEETEFADSSNYAERGISDDRWQEEWVEFERSLKTEARFYNRVGSAHLKSIFRGIGEMTSVDGRPLIISGGPGTAIDSFWRARAFQSEDKLKTAMMRPDLHLGPPPSALAAAGRMNAQGVSVFYGANDPSVAIAEVRPPVGSQVAVVKFEIIREVRLLDLTALVSVAAGGSIFDPGLSDRLERATFLGSLSARITRPVMPDDQIFEYLPTQAIADYLASGIEPEIDGILFPSVQADGEVLNVVLFHKAARVEQLDLPKGTAIEARTGAMYREGWDPEYVVIEETPPAPKAEAQATSDDSMLHFSGFDLLPWSQSDPDIRQPNLRVDLGSMRVHSVERVEFKTTEHPVRRHRWEKRDTEF
ncbi:RES family NAD+ phosphorylase [Paradevosia shaoguanensis]|uniref:RES family NAD+ phosphorylase n=1 Tax=Paradevosia shaoguanensis TaxID=1335043 RepID=UPI003C76FE99